MPTTHSSDVEMEQVRGVSQESERCNSRHPVSGSSSVSIGPTRDLPHSPQFAAPATATTIELRAPTSSPGPAPELHTKTSDAKSCTFAEDSSHQSGRDKSSRTSKCRPPRSSTPNRECSRGHLHYTTTGASRCEPREPGADEQHEGDATAHQDRAKFAGTVDELVVQLRDDHTKAVVTERQAVATQIAVNPIVQSVVTVCNLVQKRTNLDISLFLNQIQVTYFNKFYPHLNLIPCSHPKPHPHPILNIERALGEADIVSRAMRFTKHITSPIIVDVGGNRARHARLQRKIHSCNPILSASDFMRQNTITGGIGCSCLAQHCKCVQPDIHIAIHSLYYLTPADIATLCQSSSTGKLLSLTHDFDDTFGSFGAGEATYQFTDHDSLSMSVRGNTTAYRHSNLRWMRSGSCDVGSGTLAWTKIDQYTGQSSHMFCYSSRKLPAAIPHANQLSPALQDTTYYGEVSIAGPLNDKADISVGGDLLTLPGTTIYSWGSYVLVYQKTTNTIMHCPKGAVSEAAMWSMGRERSPDNFKNLLAYMRYKMKNYNLPAELLDSSVFASCSLGFIRNVAFETSVMHGVIKPLIPTISAHKDALSHKFRAVWTWRKAVAVLVAGAAVVATAGYGSATVLGTAATMYAAKIALGTTVASSAAIYARHFFSQPKPVITSSQLAFPLYHSTRASNPPRTVLQHLPPKINLPATDPTVTVEELLDDDKHEPHSHISIIDPTENREKPDAGPLVPAGIVSTMSMPVVPSNSAHSGISAICQRIIKKGPLGRGEVDHTFFTTFENYVMDNLDELGFAENCVSTMTFEEWNSKYPAHLQAAHVKALSELTTGDFREWNVDNRGMFVKIESLMKSTADGVDKLAPRAIQSGTAHHNVATGPFCKSFSKHLASVWNVDNDGGLMYATGTSAEKIGFMFQKATSRLSAALGILEGDFARFDSTIHRRFLELEAKIYKYCGCSELAYTTFLSCIATKGRDKFGTTYSVDGGRHSGDHNTSCGNTLLQGLAILFCVAVHDLMLNSRLDLRRPPFLIEKYSITLPMLGDDNLFIADSSFITTFPLADLLLKLGLELEPKVHLGANAAYHATFCSSRFYPVGDKVILAPGIGRGIAKSGWYVNPPANQPVIGLLRADAIGRAQDCSFVPFLSQMWKRNLDLSRGSSLVYSRELQRTNQHNAHVSESHMATKETYQMVEAVYGLTLDDLRQYVDMLDAVTSLPCIVDFAPLHRAMLVDGVLASGEDLEDVCLSHTPILDAKLFQQLFPSTLDDFDFNIEQQKPPSSADSSSISVCAPPQQIMA